MNGVITSREIAIDPGPGGAYAYTLAAAAAFDPHAYDLKWADSDDPGHTGLFFYHHPFHKLVYAIDLDGKVAAGFPVPASSYAGSNRSLPRDHGWFIDPHWGFGFDAHSGIPRPPGETFGSTDAAIEAFAMRGRLEMTVGIQGETRISRVVVTDRLGRDLGAETTLMEIQDPDDDHVVINDIVRSRVDPNGALYVASGIGLPPNSRSENFAIRPAPLSPVWLDIGLDAQDGWQFAIPAGDSLAVPVTLDARWLGPGTYRDTLLVRSADGSEPLLVPITLTVMPPVDTEAGPEPERATLSAPYPNPARGVAAMTLTLPRPAEVEVVLYDVLGRRITVLHRGDLAAGERHLRLDASALAPGVYAVRLEGAGLSASRRVTVIK